MKTSNARSSVATSNLVKTAQAPARNLSVDRDTKRANPVNRLKAAFESKRSSKNGSLSATRPAATIPPRSPSLVPTQVQSQSQPRDKRLWQRLMQVSEKFVDDIRKNIGTKLRNHAPVRVALKSNELVQNHNLDAIKIDVGGPVIPNAANGHCAPEGREYQCGRTMDVALDSAIDSAISEQEKMLVQGIFSGKGVFEFVSRRGHYRPAESSSTSLLAAVRAQWEQQEFRPGGMVLGGRFRVTNVSIENPPDLLPVGIEPTSAQAHFKWSLEVVDLENPTNPPRVIPFTQVGLEYKERVLDASQIERAYNMLEEHKLACQDALPVDGSSAQLMPLIASPAGRGRAPTLIVYHALVDRINAALIPDEEALDEALLEIVGEGRKVRICDDLSKNRDPDLTGFVHSDAQLKTLKVALLAHISNRKAMAIAPPLSGQRSPLIAEAFHLSRFEVVDNPGGGDCLFYSLESSAGDPTLTREQLTHIRKEVSEVLENLDDTPRKNRANAQEMAAIAHQFPDTVTVINGSVTNKAYAAHQATVGNYAGTDEVRQWLQLDRNVGKTVVLIDSVLGAERLVTITSSRKLESGDVTVDTIIGAMNSTLTDRSEIYTNVANAVFGTSDSNSDRTGRVPDDRIVIYYSPGHFARVTSLKD